MNRITNLLHRCGLTLCILLAGVLIFLVDRTRKMEMENLRLRNESSTPAVPDDSSKRREFLERENQRLRAEVATRVELEAEKQRLEAWVAGSVGNTNNAWLTVSNELQLATAQTKQDLEALWNQAHELERAKIVQKAEARLAEKRANEPADLASLERESARERSILEKWGLAIQNRNEAIRVWVADHKPAEGRAAYQATMKQSQAMEEAAKTELGPDIPLFESLPFNINEPNPKNTPIIRSVVPDRLGFSTTVYLDGSVSSAPAH